MDDRWTLKQRCKDVVKNLVLKNTWCVLETSVTITVLFLFSRQRILKSTPLLGKHQNPSTINELASDSIFEDQHQFLSQVFVSSLVSVLRFHPEREINK